MKPSERIEQIAEKLTYEATKYGQIDLNIGIKAISTYLDEQYEAEEKARQQLLKDLKPM